MELAQNFLGTDLWYQRIARINVFWNIPGFHREKFQNHWTNARVENGS